MQMWLDSSFLDVFGNIIIHSGGIAVTSIPRKAAVLAILEIWVMNFISAKHQIIEFNE